ncbi:hypothetical protein MW887_008411 [Aspergillus wentii]|nr:hypothetical protein MW887_008411 [Aspergillus wentii]
MSVNRSSSPANDDTRNSKSTESLPSVSEQDVIDQRLKYLKEEVLPFYPFLLTVPTDVPFRLGGRFVNNWAVGKDGPFTAEEQQLQYMTFLTHHEGDSLLVAVGDWSDGAGNIMTDERSGPQSAGSTPSNGSFKKKISLNDYKNKRKGGASPSPTSQDTSTLHVPSEKPRHSKASPTENPTPRPMNNASSSSKNSIGPTPESSARKRAPENEHDLSRFQEGKSTLTMSSPKRARVSPEGIGMRDTVRSKANGLPTLLSPTLPPTSSSPRLPRLLSPTLPPDIEKELSTIYGDSPRIKGSISIVAKNDISKEKSTDRDRLHLDSARGSSPQSLLNKPLVTATDRNVSSVLGSIGSEPGEIIKTNIPPPVSDKQSQHVSSSVTLKNHMPTSNHRKPQRADSVKTELVVKLRYGRSNRKRVEALLKFSGKRKGVTSSSPLKEPSDYGSVRDKREDQVYSEKRAKQVSSDGSKTLPRERLNELKVTGLEKPQTPVSSTASLAPSQQDKAKLASVTPTKDLKGSCPRQSESTDIDGKTPIQRVTKYPPGESVTDNKLSPSQPTSTVNRSRNCERRAWKEEFQKYSNLGRELKHAAERYTAKDGATSADEKLAAATAIEAILCFVIAFVADDQYKALGRQTGDSSTWLSILAYWRVVKKNSTLYPHLHGLCLILGAVSYDAIHALDLERLAISPLPGEHTAVPTPGSDGNAVISDESKRNRKEFLDLKNRLPECHKESQKLWLEGMQGLSEDVLMREFPITWSNRSRNYAERGRQRLKVGDYFGEYFLPLGRTNTPVEVVRFGWSTLNEWCLKENVDWKGRLGL